MCGNKCAFREIHSGKDVMWNRIGLAIAIAGSSMSLIGGVANNLLLNHIAAMYLWAVANPMMLIFIMGVYDGKWKNGIGLLFVAGSYAFFFVTGVIGLVML